LFIYKTALSDVSVEILKKNPLPLTERLSTSQNQKGKFKLNSSGFFATQKPLHYPSFLLEELNKRFNGSANLQFATPKFACGELR
ncbi:MAG: hypothetical protein U9P44_03240, partial [archaeon]|nr:hypothetical protein [archaeon]